MPERLLSPPAATDAPGRTQSSITGHNSRLKRIFYGAMGSHSYRREESWSLVGRRVCMGSVEIGLRWSHCVLWDLVRGCSKVAGCCFQVLARRGRPADLNLPNS